MSRRRSAAVGVSAALVLLLATPALAAPGDLDASFGTGGKVTTSLAGGGNEGNTVVVQPDGRILVGGWAYAKGFAVIRYLRNGALDPSFGDGGVVTTNFPTGPAVITDLALEPDGGIVAAGLSEGYIAIARYRSDGSLDRSFGRDGLVTARYKRWQTSAEGVAIAPGGDVVVAGTANSTLWVVARFTPRGHQELQFGHRGWGEVNFGKGEEVARDLAITPNGRIVLAGTGRNTFGLVRLRRDGLLDPQFGTNGRVTTRFKDRGSAAAVSLLRDGDILAAGQSGNGFELARYLPSGRLDRSFGHGGLASGPKVLGVAYDMAVAPDGSAVLAGSAYQDFTIARYTPGGALDSSFGNAGVVHTNFPNYGAAQGVSLAPDGRIVVVGDTGLRIGLARYRS